MNITNELKKVGVLLTNDRFIAILEEVTRAAMTKIKVDSIAR
jgi:hypothetical protein